MIAYMIETMVEIVVAALLAAAPVGTAQSGALRLAATQDLSSPFWCDWGYDWDGRCYRDDVDRLPIGGEEDKVWRAGLRFSLDALPPGGPYR
jgi:hypothetical protein